MTYALGIFGIGAVVIAAPLTGIKKALFSVLIVSLAIAPKTIYTHADARYVGIAPSGTTIYTFTLVALVLTVVAAVTGRFAGRAVAVWLPFLASAAVALHYWWPHDALTWSGELHFITAICCYAVGYALVRTGALRESDAPRTFYIVVAAQLVAVAADVLGHPLLTAKGPQAQDLAGRVIGTMNHPDQLAKLMLIAIVVILSYAPADVWERRVQRVSVVAALAIIALTLGRAVFIGAVVGVVVYLLLEPNRVLRRRQLLIAVGSTVVVAVAASSFIARFQADPRGGARPQLQELSLRVIDTHARSGVGLNHYVSAVGQWDPLTASGVPVHNAFLLSIAEMGIAAGVLLWAPFAILLLRAVPRLRQEGCEGLAARAYAALVPGLALTAATGWGLLQAPTFELLCLVAGMFAARLCYAPKEAALPVPAWAHT